MREKGEEEMAEAAEVRSGEKYARLRRPVRRSMTYFCFENGKSTPDCDAPCVVLWRIFALKTVKVRLTVTPQASLLILHRHNLDTTE